jgi:hypothetical protein
MLGFYRIELAKARRRYLICRGFFTGDLRAAAAKSRFSTSRYKGGAVIGGMANFAIRSIDNIPLKLY